MTLVLSAGACLAPLESMRMRNDFPRPLAVGPAEAARLLGIGRTRLYQALGSGTLRSFRVGTRRLIRLADLETWLEGHAVRNPEERRSG